MIRTGTYVGEHLTDTNTDGVSHEQIQPNGVDLTVSGIERITGRYARFNRDDYRKPAREAVEYSYTERPGAVPHFRLYPGHYAVIYGEKVTIPEGHVGRVYPRSRVMRSGLHLTSALWDQGYEGRGEGLLIVPTFLDRITIEAGASLAQMVFIEAESVPAFDQYDGTHQGERL